MEYDGYLLAITAIILVAQLACSRITEQNSHIRAHFEFFGSLFACEAIIMLYKVLIGILLVYTDLFSREFRGIVLATLEWIETYFCIILPLWYLVFIIHTILTPNEKYRLITVRFTVVVLAIVCVAYPICELLGVFNRMNQFCTFSENVKLMSEYTEIVNFLLLLGSFCCVDLKKTASLHRLLLIVGVAVHLTFNRIIGLRPSSNDPSIAYAWHALPLFLPIVYYFATRKHENDWKKGEEEQKIDTVSII